MASQSESDEHFEKFLEVALQESPPDVAEQLRAGLKKRYDKPPMDEMALCVGRSVPLSKARKVLFYPDEDDMRLYPALIAMPPPDAPNNHPQRNIQVCALASLYLVHSKSWERVRPFIEAGGLRQLAAALAHPNPYLASQAMSALLHITDEELLFPWHDPPPTSDGRGPRQGPYGPVWRAMFDLSGGALFLPNLLAHYRHPPVFPGASYMALRLFAFYLSWMRRHFTQDNRLSLSASLLALLERWGADPLVSEEERELASALYKDFNRFPPAKEPQQPATGADAPAPGAEQQHLLGGLDGAEEDLPVTVVSERTEINSGPSSDNEAELLKEQGNEAYKRGEFTAAVHLYSAAMDSLVPQERLLTEGPRRAAYHANRAAAYMARAAAGKLREGDADTAGYLEGVDHGSEGAVARHYEAAILDCDAAMELQPTGRAAAKTMLRKSRALLQLGRREEAEAAARTGLGKCDSASDGPVGELRADLQEALRAAAQQSGKSKAGKKEAEARAQSAPSGAAPTHAAAIKAAARAEPETAAAAEAAKQSEAGGVGKAAKGADAQARVAAPAAVTPDVGGVAANGSGSIAGDPFIVTSSTSTVINWNAMD